MMTSSPPRLASWALALLLPAADRDLVLGDLWEEFHEHMVPAIGGRQARRWYWRQAIASIYPLVSRLWRAATPINAAMAALALVLSLLPSCLLLTVRGFALSQVPLKTTAEPSALFVLTFVICTVLGLAAGVRCALGVLGGVASRR